MDQHSKSEWRAVVLAVCAIFWLIFPDVAMAQDGLKQPVAQQPDTFPVGLGYAAIAAATTVWGVLTTVVGKLYYGREQDKKDAQAQIDSIKKDAQVALDAAKKDAQVALEAFRNECRQEIARLRDRLEQEQKERREEAEKLLREQKDIMREVMVTCSAISDALRKNTETLERMTQAWRNE